MAELAEAQPGSFKIVNKCYYRITLGRHTPPDSLFRAANRRPLISVMHVICILKSHSNYLIFFFFIVFFCVKTTC